MRVVFIGTDTVGEVALRKMAESRHEIVLVISQPDRPKGRGRKITPGPVKIAADELGIQIIQPESIKDESVRNKLNLMSPDIITVASYGEFIPASIFNMPPHLSINVHPSLLPRWRGAAPVRYALLAGDSKTGVSIQYVAKKMDTGDILLQEEIDIEPTDNHGTLEEKLYPLGGELLVRAVNGIEDSTIEPREQDESIATYAPKIEKTDLVLDWSLTAEELHNRIRAFAPSPGARSEFRGKVCKVLESDLMEAASGGTSEPGTIIQSIMPGPAVACGEGVLRLKLLQPAGKKPVTGEDFLNGYRPEPGEKFS